MWYEYTPIEKFPMQPMDVVLKTPERPIVGGMGATQPIPIYTGEAESWMWPVGVEQTIVPTAQLPAPIPVAVTTHVETVAPAVPGIIPGTPEQRGRALSYGLLGLGALVLLYLLMKG